MRRWALLLAAGLLGALALLLAGPWLEIAPDPLAPADVIVVLGGGEPQRPQRAAALYRAGFAPEVWYTGTTVYDLVSPGNLAANQLLRRGVPAAALRLLPSVSTETDALAVAAQAAREQRHSLLLITDWYHSRRALCMLRRQLAGQDVTVHYAAADLAEPQPSNWWSSRRGWQLIPAELFKTLYYRLSYGSCRAA